MLLLDEITVDLDVLGRADLLSYLQEETEQRNATIIYVNSLLWCTEKGHCHMHKGLSGQESCLLQATHIFDGLESWPTHIMYLAGGRLKVFEPASAFPELKAGRLLELIEK